MSPIHKTHLQTVHQELLDRRFIAPIAPDEREQLAFIDCDLSSYAGHRLGDNADPRFIDSARRKHWLAHAAPTNFYTEPPATRTFHTCYWILHQNERVGSIALNNSPNALDALHLASFYIYPPFRNQGIGKTFMLNLIKTVTPHRLPLSLNTSWTWQSTVRFYLNLGFWLWSWSTDLFMYWSPTTPNRILKLTPNTASISVLADHTPIRLVWATNHKTYLEMIGCDAALQHDERLGDAFWISPTTLCLILALEGWPLIRSPEEWKRCSHAPNTAPEALARKITVWEATELSRGWLVNTPRIPGLAYPSLEEFAAQGNA